MSVTSIKPEGGISDPEFMGISTNARKGGLQRGQQLGLELAVETVAGIVPADVAADVRIEQDRVADAVAVLAEAADGDINIDPGALVDHAERNGRGRAVFVADELLGVEVVHALILGRLALKVSRIFLPSLP